MLRVSDLTLPDRAGQLLWIGFDGTSFGPPLEAFLRRVRPGGIILFGRNIESARQVRSLTDALFKALPVPPFIALDQEGGRVNRLKPILGPTPAPNALARMPVAAEAVRRHSAAMALALKCLGFNVNFAPVLDLSRADEMNGIGDRSFGEDARTVADLAGQFVKVHLEAGVVPVGKHFPGLGSARADTHLTLPVIRRSRELLLKHDVHPFRQLRRTLPIVMVGHAYYPALQGRTPAPATLSHRVVGVLLRQRIAYRGLVLTDDLEMGALGTEADPGVVALEALRAGSDAVMFCGSQQKIVAAHEAILGVLRNGGAAARDLMRPLRRALSLKQRHLQRRRSRFSAGSLRRSRLLLESLGPAATGADPTARL